jgi:hypothetical protein
MAYHGSVTRTSLESAITPELLRVTAIIQLALMAGPVFFLVMVVMILFQQQGTQSSGGENEILWMLTIAQLAFAVVSFLGGQFLVQFRTAQWRASGDVNSDDAATLARKCIEQHRVATLMRLAPVEGAAIFGLCVCMIAATQGALPSEPKYWINLASTALLLMYGAITLPSKERIGEWFEKVYLN